MPTFVRLEQWNPRTREWVVNHAGLNLLDPQRYVERYAQNGKTARAIEVETGKVFGLAEAPKEDDCVLCGEPHMHGMCLI